MLLRYKALDKCFRSHKKWTLEMLVAHCSKVLGEKISKRSVQSDIQFLRDNNAPIIVTEKKYYSYDNKWYSIFKNTIPSKLEEQFAECIDFVREMSDFPKYKQYKDNTSHKENFSAEYYVKKWEQQLFNSGYFDSSYFFSSNEVRKITSHIHRYNIADGDSIIKDKVLLKRLLNPSLRKIVKKIDTRVFLVDAIYSTKQKEHAYEQSLHLPMRQRKIPQNLTLWGYPSEEKYEKPNRKILYSSTFAIQIFLKDVTRNTGALQVIPGSQQRELTPLEVSLIANNCYPTACEVNKGGIVGYKPMLIQRIEPSESPKNKQSITLWFSSYHLPVHYVWNNEINI